MSERIIKYTEALKEAADQMLAQDPKMFIVGLGVSYKNGADGTTAGLAQKYPGRVLDTPVSENAVTGMAVGAAINGLHPLVHHGRIEFALLAADPMFTQAAKWNYMFGGGNPVPIVLRINVGRQWGNGPQHTQSLYAMFGSVAGLKVVVPSTPKMAKGLLVAALKDKNPVVLLEPRWLFQLKENVPEEMYDVPLDKARVVKEGSDITVVSYGDGFVAVLEALELLPKDVSVELIDMVSLSPIDHDAIARSVAKTGRLLTVDTTTPAFNVGSEVIAEVARRAVVLKGAPQSLSCPLVPCPTSTALTAEYYPTKVDIVGTICKMLGKPAIERELSFEELHLPPGRTL
ncbi:MAG: alpha-ketoacid dehydrogenase subunit beta [Patescibacteria group bacterium]|nr:alpha-ketoacid dehydrogenase subunit beta [Patescibacteria group bacterium]